LQNTPDSSPPDSPRTPPPPKRGSTTSPGQEALTAGGRWLAILVYCHHKTGLDAGGLSLINDLVQLLYYHGSGVAQKHRDDESDGTAHLLSPVVQVRDLTLCFLRDCSIALSSSVNMPGQFHVHVVSLHRHVEACMCAPVIVQLKHVQCVTL
jgi:hypothetical protein